MADLRKAARGRECQVRIPGGSDFDLSGGVADPDTDDVRADAQPGVVA